MNNPIVVPMCISVSEVEFPMQMSSNMEELEPGVASAFILNGRVTGVKGSAETDFRIGDVSLSPSDLGMDPSSYALRTELPTKTSDLTNDSGFITNAEIPTKTSDLVNDSGFIDGAEVPLHETDPTVPQWAKSPTKPSYTASEVGAVPTSRTVNGKALSTNITLNASDVGALPSSTVVPDRTSQLTNDSGFINGSQVPSNETDPTVPSWAKAPTKPTYTASEVGALPDTTVIPSATSQLTNDSGFITSADVPTKTSDLTNDSGFITGSQVPSHETDPTVPSWAKASTKPTYTASEVGALPNTGESILDGTNSVLNLKSASATNSPILRFQRGTLTDNYNDWQIQDRGGFLYFDQRGSGSTAFNEMVHFDTSGNVYATGLKGYLDWSYVSNKPTIPTQTSQLTNNSGFITGADVPSNETDPTVPNWAKASAKPSYTASEVGALPDTTVIPSATSQLTNDSGFITSSAIPTNVSAFANDVPYAVANSDGASLSTMAIPMGSVDSTSTATVFTATVPGITELKTGVCMMLSNHVVTSASGFTIDINNLGAKPVYSNMTNATRDTTIFNVAYTMLFVYDESLDDGDGGWWCYRGYDANTNTIGYQIRTNSSSLPMQSVTYRYRILFTDMDGTHFVPPTNSTSTNATASRTVNQAPIDPFGRIVYYGATASVATGSRPSASALWQEYTLSLGYSFNRTGSALALTSWKPVYVKATPQSDGSAIIDATTPYVQDLPTTEDGKIYIYLGIAYSATNIELTLEHPVKHYSNGAIRNWFPNEFSSAQGRSF